MRVVVHAPFVDIDDCDMVHAPRCGGVVVVDAAGGGDDDDDDGA
jgi:hypothetical protein